MTSPVTLPLVGRMSFGHTAKEKLLEFWREVEKRTGLQIRYRERVEAITRDQAGFVVRTTGGEYRTASVAARDRAPRHTAQARRAGRGIAEGRLPAGRPGAVRGPDTCSSSAAATARSKPRPASPRAGARSVTLSYRGEAFSRAKPANRERVAAAERSGRLKQLFRSEVRRIEQDRVILDCDGRDVELPNDAVIVSAGGILPSDFLRGIGVEVETKYGTA